jgi:hypothetical protein
MPYTRFNVVKAGDSYTDRDGKERTSWDNVGTMIRNEESGALSLKLFLTGEWYSIFEDTRERRDDGGPDRTQGPEPPTTTKKTW